jgi:hypothetical protein
MDSISCDKTRLMETLKENREKHRKIYAKASEGYIKNAGKWLKRKQDELNKKPDVDINLNFGISKPYHHLEEYDTAIGMLEWNLDTNVNLTKQQFENFVLDKWSWTTKYETMASGCILGANN